MKSPIDNVSDTALWVAVYRADEMQKPNPLFRDPFAGRLAGDRGRDIAKRMLDFRYTSWAVVIRTCIIDAYINNLISQGLDTVLNLGAGLDARPYRMDLPSSLRWIEVDYPHLIAHKEKILSDDKPRCQLERRKLDLSDRKVRAQLFFEVNSKSKKTLILTEGVIPYLKEEEVAFLAEELRLHESFQFWIVDYFSPLVLRLWRTRRRKKQMQNAPLLFVPNDWFGFFGQHGWKTQEVRYLAEESERLGRDVPLPWWIKILRLLPLGKKRDIYKRLSGYVLLVPN